MEIQKAKKNAILNQKYFSFTFLESILVLPFISLGLVYLFAKVEIQIQIYLGYLFVKFYLKHTNSEQNIFLI